MTPKQYIDAARNPLGDTDWGLKTEVSIDFTGGGAPGANTLFSVTGTVLLRLLAICETTLTGASATIEAGISGNTAKFIAQSTGTDLIAGEIWHDNSPDSKVELSSVLSEFIVSNDVILTVGTAALTDGKIKFVACWYPLTENGNVTAIKGGVVNATSPSTSPSPSPSISLSVSPSASVSPSSSSSPSQSPSASVSSSASVSPSSSDSVSVSPSVSPSASVSPSSSSSVSTSPSASISPSASTSISPSSSTSPSASQSPSPSVSISPSGSVSPSSSKSPSSSQSPSASSSSSISPSPSPSA